jgi:hypothetical protein
MAVKLLALRVDSPLTPRKTPGTHFCYRLRYQAIVRLEGLRKLKNQMTSSGNFGCMYLTFKQLNIKK